MIKSSIEFARQALSVALAEGIEVFTDPALIPGIIQSWRHSRQSCGKGFVFVNFGVLDVESGEFKRASVSDGKRQWLESYYLDQALLYDLFPQSNYADQIWAMIQDAYESQNSEETLICVFAASADRGKVANPRYLFSCNVQTLNVKAFEQSVTANISSKRAKKIKPAKLTRQQIEARLDDLYHSGNLFLFLDKSNPLYAGNNLTRWIHALRGRQQKGQAFRFSVISSSEYSANLPPDLAEDADVISLKS